MSTTALTDDGWAILALPVNGRRDLACVETWERSLRRSRQRRARAATQRANLPASRKVGFAVAATALIAPLAQQTASAQETATTRPPPCTGGGVLKKGARGAAVSALQSRARDRCRRRVRPGHEGRGDRLPVAQRARRRRDRGPADPGRARRGVLLHDLRWLGSGDSGPKPSRSVTIALQQKLGLAADGVYGPQSRAAVRAFQARNGLEVDGVVGPATMAALGISGSSAPAPSSEWRRFGRVGRPRRDRQPLRLRRQRAARL